MTREARPLVFLGTPIAAATVLSLLAPTPDVGEARLQLQVR
jgi:hypothetical protein